MPHDRSVAFSPSGPHCPGCAGPVAGAQRASRNGGAASRQADPGSLFQGEQPVCMQRLSSSWQEQKVDCYNRHGPGHNLMFGSAALNLPTV